ncbi:glycosyltransferase [Pedobacter sp. ASV12]|uniref:glycosyltransferase n=1 Tax=Pedobacter sp. ASV12 TaxID=2795120 RepID=UPI0018EA945E|nr:glycosyltransferase [Pedobacter sp. ASV12]
MPKLRIGIPINFDYNPLAGGSYSYVKQLINAIDTHEFDPGIEVLFLNFEKKNIHTQKKLLTFHPFSSFTLADLCRKLFIVCLHKMPFGLFKNWLYRLENKHASARDQKIKKVLNANNIKLLFYVNPDGNRYDFPFITIHWDIGHVSTYMFPEFSENLEARKAYYNEILPKALLILTETVAGKEELASYTSINPDRIKVMPIFPGNVVEENIEVQEQLDILQRFKLSPQQFFVYPAQFWAHKNHILLIDAFEILLKKHPATQLVFTGSDKGNLSYVKQYIDSKKLTSYVKILGFVQNNELFTLYKNAISLVMPTFLGPSNMPPLEAASLNCPVIISDLKGHRELLGSYARYFDPLNAADMAAAMLAQIAHGHQTSFEHKDRFSIQAATDALNQAFVKAANLRKTWA